ncbi:beta-ketoacyl-ACP synthase III [Salsipaludibacter albus]|uniref:beta-ketoacyl-ACP synthase III n=1 Tax=Salsipaludibacter albus TaxID=2849650 RepID=UPI001EE48781|nr:beta-ketoacyl-ACP synthase III [Salsipaludibacter albus]MBY5164206.1 ketoacyl-ACP synthase III [Salsipaludibacter albus]
MASPLAEPATRSTDRLPGSLPMGVLGLGHYLPDEVVTNDDLSEVLDTSDEWIRTRTGIQQRHRLAPEDATSDLATRAARRALDDAGLEAGDIGQILVATTTPDYPISAVAPIVADNLGVLVPALDVNAACSGFLYGLRTAAGLLATGTGPVLLIGAEALTRVVDPGDRNVAVLFGDGAGAVVLGMDDDGSLGPFDLGADGSDPSSLYTPVGGTREPTTDDNVGERRHFLTMRGREIYRFAVANMTASSQTVLRDAGLTPDDIDLFVGHQANLRILDAVAAKVGIPAERCHTTVHLHGNTSAASIPLALAHARDAGRLHAGDRVLLTAFGAGLTWGSCLLTWSGA